MHSLHPSSGFNPLTRRFCQSPKNTTRAPIEGSSWQLSAINKANCPISDLRAARDHLSKAQAPAAVYSVLVPLGDFVNNGLVGKGAQDFVMIG
jgi:hypothetical protein